MADESLEKAGAADSGAPKASKPLIPLLGGVIGGAVVSFLMCQFVLIPQIKKAALSGGAPLSADAETRAEEHVAEKKKDDSHGGGHGGKDESKDASKATYTKEGWTYAFPTVTANLTGSLGKQYLKCGFQIVSDDKGIGNIIEENKGKLKDVVLSVLSSRSLADVESPSAKTVLRTELVANLNKALNSSVVKQVQFTDFLIQ